MVLFQPLLRVIDKFKEHALPGIASFRVECDTPLRKYSRHCPDLLLDEFAVISRKVLCIHAYFCDVSVELSHLIEKWLEIRRFVRGWSSSPCKRGYDLERCSYDNY